MHGVHLVHRIFDCGIYACQNSLSLSVSVFSFDNPSVLKSWAVGPYLTLFHVVMNHLIFIVQYSLILHEFSSRCCFIFVFFVWGRGMGGAKIYEMTMYHVLHCNNRETTHDLLPVPVSRENCCKS